MTPAKLLADLRQRGIELKADGDQLRFNPKAAVTPELLARLKAAKGGLLALLRDASGFDVDSAPNAKPDPITEKRTHGMPQDLRRRVEATFDTRPIIAPATATEETCCCGSTTWRDVPIHDGESMRRDCARCGRFIDFPVWYGKEY
jgi:hypothetical protein